MDISFVTVDTLNCAWQEKMDRLSNSDLIVFGFNGLGLINYKKELSGETEYFQDLATFSKQISSVVISGCDTDTYGVFRHSAVIADKGKILGVTDMMHSIDETEFTSGGSIRVYDTSIGKIGILILEDLFFPESVRMLSLCDADIIICEFKKIESLMPQIILRSSSFCNGVCMALCSEKCAFVTNVKGDILAQGSADIIKAKVKIEKDYHLISSRRRGLYREFEGSY